MLSPGSGDGNFLLRKTKFKNNSILFHKSVLYSSYSVRVGRPGLPLGADVSPAFYRENAGVFRKEGDSGLVFLTSAACFLRSKFSGHPFPGIHILLYNRKEILPFGRKTENYSSGRSG